MYYLSVAAFVIILTLFYTAVSTPATLLNSLSRFQNIDKVFINSLFYNQKLLGVGTALLVVLLSATAFRRKDLSSVSNSILKFMSEYKPLMLNRKWNPGSSRQSRSTLETRRAHKNGGEIGGLSNEGNTCFMNSVLQSLASSHSLLKFFDENIYEDTTVYANDEVTKVRTGSLNSHMRFTAALKSLLDDLNGTYGSRGKEFSTRNFMKKMPDGPKQNFFMGYNQEDAQEFYQSVMRIVEKEYKKSHSSNSPSPEPEAKEDAVKYIFASDIPNHITGCHSLGKLGTVYVPAHQVDPNIPDEEDRLAPLELVTPVDGVSAERIGCISCGETGGIRYSVNSGLSLNLPYDRSYGTHYELLQLLNEWKKPELIDDVNCNRCGLIQTKEFLQENIESSSNETLVSNFEKRVHEIDEELEKDHISDEVFEKLTTKQMIRKTTKSKQILLSRPPPLLCIHINRSVIDPNTFMILKNSKSVSFPAVLDLNNFVADPDSINMDARLPFSKRDEFVSNGELLEGEEFSDSAEDASLNDTPVDDVREEPKVADVLEESKVDDSATPSESPVEPPIEQNEDLKYQLKAVISHMGTHNYGHYICYRRWRGTWWKANDEAVYVTTEDEVLSSPGTFMLFYELKDGSDEYPDAQEDGVIAEHDLVSGSGKETPVESSSSSDENEEEVEVEGKSSDEIPRSDSEEERREMFPNAEFKLGEERAYHV